MSMKEEEKVDLFSMTQEELNEYCRIKDQKQRDEFREQKKCIFEEAYSGYCGREGYPFCAEHLKWKCKHKDCQKQATHQCEDTRVLVCGHSLCEEHSWCPHHMP